MAQVLLAVFGISLLMIVHEAGHYAMARATGMRVLTFSIGLGPALLRFRPKGSPTTFQICLVPLLAYVRIDGAVPFEEHDPNDAGLYMNKGPIARALTLAGGPLANYLFASLVVFGLALAGWREARPISPMVIDRVEAGSVAEVAGLRAGDVIVEVEGQAVSDVSAMSAITGGRAGKPTRFTILRDGETISSMLAPQDRGGRGVIGVTAKTETHVRKLSVSEAAIVAVRLPWVFTQLNGEGMAELVRHRTTAGVTGPVGMAKHVASEAERGAHAYLMILVAISVGLGFFNLLPLPFLDGGRLVFVLYELVAGRRPNRVFETAVHAAGMVILLGVAALVTWRDVLG